MLPNAARPLSHHHHSSLIHCLYTLSECRCCLVVLPRTSTALLLSSSSIMSYSTRKNSSATPSVVTPSSSDLVAFGLHDDPSDAVPWPDNTYNIIEESTGRVLDAYVHHLFGPRVRLLDPNLPRTPAANWLCVEANGCFGLFNQHGNVYLSAYTREKGMPSTFGPDQYIVPRRHPKGGYQLLSPAGNIMKHFAFVSSDGTFVRRQHAGTIWRFVKSETGDY